LPGYNCKSLCHRELQAFATSGYKGYNDFSNLAAVTRLFSEPGLQPSFVTSAKLLPSSRFVRLSARPASAAIFNFGLQTFRIHYLDNFQPHALFLCQVTTVNRSSN
jgi:hypothetical protein